MKILLELDNSITEGGNTNQGFEWSSKISNSLFLVQRKCMKILSIGDGFANETQAINLADSNTCTYWSWNKTANQLAMVLNKKSVYIWEAASNTFNHIKPLLAQPKPKADKTVKSKYVSIIRWSSISDTLLICYSTGQLLLCKNKPPWEKFVDNCEGVLSRVTSIDCSDHEDCFACITETNEILVMTFAGSAMFYMRGNMMQVLQLKLSSYSSRERCSSKMTSTAPSERDKFWLAYQSESNKIHITELKESNMNETTPESNLIYYEADEVQEALLVDFFWVSASQLVVCYSNGVIRLVQIKQGNSLALCSDQVLDISMDDERDVGLQLFKSYTLRTVSASSLEPSLLHKSMSLLAVSRHSVYYYEIFKVKGILEYTFEKVDHLNLENSISKIDVGLERVELSCDCSLLAMQLSNGHLLIYQSKLQDLMLTKHGGRICYLSSPTEITVLNYGSTTEVNEAPVPENNAQTFSIDFRPSVIAVGPKHLAIALNNRIRFYLLNSIERDSPSENNPLVEERECMSIVIEMSLCSQFVAVQFDDGRLKLHPIKSKIDTGEEASISSSSELELNERFFPDPTKPEKITAFLLTEHLLIYSTQELRIVVFSLYHWTNMQTCECLKFFMNIPIGKLVSNTKENKFVCLPLEDRTDKSNIIFVYDLFRNSMIRVLDESSFSQISEKQSVVYSCSEGAVTILDNPWSNTRVESLKLDQVKDAVWDTDGRTLLLVDSRLIIVLASLDHTLSDMDFTIEFVGTSRKCMSYNVLYSSQGIVSFQTPLGRVVNSVLESHDDEAKLIKLEQQIRSCIVSTKGDMLQEQSSIMNMKLAYLRSILPIYSLTKCQQICQYLVEEDILNYPKQQRYTKVDDVIWRHLAAWALYTMQLNFGLTIYRKYKMLVQAQMLTDIMKDARSNGFDTKSSLKTKLFVLLGCEL